MSPLSWSQTAKTVFAIVYLHPSSFIEVCEAINAKNFAGQKKVRNALQELRKDGAIYWKRKWHVVRDY